MPVFTRRTLVRTAAQAAIAQSLLGRAIAKALAIPAARRSGTVRDVEHVVILMLENRSFDHYFGTLAGVCGFADPRPLLLPDGAPVWRQPDGAGGFVAPFRFDTTGTNFPIMKSLDHSWETGHAAWNGGRYDGWIAAKSGLTMGHVARADISYHFALADAFTVCDAYFCSVLGPTCPNRLHLFTGSADPFGRGGGPVIDCTDITQRPDGKVFGRGWRTYPERLQAAGVAWQVYRQGTDPGSDDDSDGGMNSLIAFAQYRESQPGDALYEYGVRPRRIDKLKQDVIADRLASVSWIVPPRLFCEHPKWPPVYGVQYIARTLDALTANPAVWSKTVFFLMYDENDGFFDHVPPPVPPLADADGISTVGVEGERHTGDGRPFGLGMRVPMLVISPWSKGGWVCSDVFDHTSIIRFLETRFGVKDDNISPWRRTVCGDLTTAFDFANPNIEAPKSLAIFDAGAALPDQAVFNAFKASYRDKPKPSVPPVQTAPSVEAGRRRMRPLPYDFDVRDRIENGYAVLDIVNTGRAGAAFQVQDRLASSSYPRRYTIEAGKSVTDRWAVAADGRYDLELRGPNGFLRAFQGDLPSQGIGVSARHDGARGRLVVAFSNARPDPVLFHIRDRHSGRVETLRLAAHARHEMPKDLAASDGWYDMTVTCAGFAWLFCGHVETGTPSLSNPLTVAAR